MTTYTENFNLFLPEVGGDRVVWATYTNANWVAVDALLASMQVQITEVVAPAPPIVRHEVTEATATKRALNYIIANNLTIRFPAKADCVDGERIWFRVLDGVFGTSLEQNPGEDEPTIELQTSLELGVGFAPWALEFELDKTQNDWLCTGNKTGRIA